MDPVDSFDHSLPFSYHPSYADVYTYYIHCLKYLYNTIPHFFVISLSPSIPPPFSLPLPPSSLSPPSSPHYHIMYLCLCCCQVGLVAEKAQDQLSQANEQLRVDVEKWHEAKNKEVCQFMRQFAINHMEYHQKVHVRIYMYVNKNNITQ